MDLNVNYHTQNALFLYVISYNYTLYRYYMVGGSSKQGQENGIKWIKEYPEATKKLLDILTTVVIDYMSAQVDAGADLMQLFEAMGEFITPDLFNAWAMPCMERISREMRERHPDIPLMVFPRGATYALDSLQAAGYDVVSLDTKTNRVETKNRLQKAAGNHKKSSLQGNFDVALLQAGASSVEQIYDAVGKMLDDFGTQCLIANLGEGLTGKEDPVLVAAFIDAVHELSAKRILIGQSKPAAPRKNYYF
jgi:uroporphyrinogen decarboxylase